MQTLMQYKRWYVLIAVFLVAALFTAASLKSQSKLQLVAHISFGFDKSPSNRTYFWLDDKHVMELYRLESNNVDVQECAIGGACVENSTLSAALSKSHPPNGVSSIRINKGGDHALFADWQFWRIIDIKTGSTKRLVLDDLSGLAKTGVWNLSGNKAIILQGNPAFQSSLITCAMNGSCGSPSFGSFDYSYYDNYGVIGNGWVMGITSHVGDGTVSAVQADPGSPPGPRNIFFIPTPPDAYGDFISRISPTGTRIVWLFNEAPPPFGIAILNQTQFMSSMPTGGVSIWISDTSGNHMHEMYSVRAPRDAIAGLQWSPDERWISFIKDNNIWRYPVS
jgi:hypothetical protein